MGVSEILFPSRTYKKYSTVNDLRLTADDLYSQLAEAVSNKKVASSTTIRHYAPTQNALPIRRKSASVAAAMSRQLPEWSAVVIDGGGVCASCGDKSDRGGPRPIKRRLLRTPKMCEIFHGEVRWVCLKKLKYVK